MCEHTTHDMTVSSTMHLCIPSRSTNACNFLYGDSVMLVLILLNGECIVVDGTLCVGFTWTLQRFTAGVPVLFLVTCAGAAHLHGIPCNFYFYPGPHVFALFWLICYNCANVIIIMLSLNEWMLYCEGQTVFANSVGSVVEVNLWVAGVYGITATTVILSGLAGSVVVEYINYYG